MGAQSGECALCRPQLLTPVLRESASWRIAVNRNQNLLGKLIIALRRHEESVAQLTPEEWSELREELRWAVDRLNAAFQPDHFNCAFLQNQDRHVHLHVIPRYAGPRTLAGLEFTDSDWPDHYQPGVEFIAPSDVIAAIAGAVAAR
ncbi:MAG TPA: HIT family protein [Gaiellaceae bacterium]|nr:HIT family protein [Gaiellaceae bacterium]